MSGNWVRIIADNYNAIDHHRMIGRIGVVVNHYSGVWHLKIYDPNDSYKHKTFHDLGFYNYEKIDSKMLQLIGDSF